jgi:diamine N-acetyltransferase
MKYLENDNLSLQKPEPEDLEFLFTLENNTEFWHLSDTKTPFTRWHIKQHIENSSYDIYTNKELRLIIRLKENKLAIGVIDLFDFDPNNLRAGIGIVILPEFQKKGIASQSLELVIKYGFEVLNLNQFYCQVDEDNNASVRLFENVGFSKCGTLRKWKRRDYDFIDVSIYQLYI